MKSQLPSLALATALLSLASACASGPVPVPESGSIAAGRTPNGFTSMAQIPGVVNIEASFRDDHERAIGADDDLLEDYGIIPIWIGIIPPTNQGSKTDLMVDVTRMKFRLHLEDGTVLEAVDPGRVTDDEDINAAAVGATIKNGFLQKELRGFVYFPLAPRKQFEVDGAGLTREWGEYTRELQIARCLVSFQMTIEDRPTTFFLGVARSSR